MTPRSARPGPPLIDPKVRLPRSAGGRTHQGMTFNENDHPRGDAGRFTETHHAEPTNVALAGPADFPGDFDTDGLTADEIAHLKAVTTPGAAVVWTDPDGGDRHKGRVLRAVGEAVEVATEGDGYIEALPEELTPAPSSGVSADPDRDSIRALMGVSARTGLSTDSVPYIAGLLQKGGPEVHEENAATLAASYGVTPDAIQEVHRVVNHEEIPLTVAAGVNENDADLLGAGGLTGHLAPYTGDLDDLEDLDDPIAYTSPSGRDLILSSVSEGEFTVTYADGDDDNNFTLSQGVYDATPAEKAATVKDALWDLAVTDANYDSPTPLQTGDFYELREVELSQVNGKTVGEVLASNDDGMYTTLTHNFDTGTTGVYRDGHALTGTAADLEMAAVFEGLGSEPADGDFHTHAATVFTNLLTTSAAHADAPRWAAETAAVKGL